MVSYYLLPDGRVLHLLMLMGKVRMALDENVLVPEISEKDYRRALKKRKNILPCAHHKPKSAIMGHGEHSEWIAAKIKRGHKQYYCPKFGLWLFKCEL